MVNIAIVDTHIRNYEQLISYIEPNTIIETIPDNSNGIDIMINTVKKYNNINSLHILSHGFSGIAILGNSKLTEESISDYPYLNEIHTHFAQDGEILMYGCNLAAYDKGYNFINKLADVTKLTVTASMNIVGHKSLRGSWDLNYSTGNTNRSVIISEEGQNVWHDRLTHYRGGHLHWSTNGTARVMTLVVTSYWRHNAHDEGLATLFVPNFNGGIIDNDIASTIYIDDEGVGESVGGPNTGLGQVVQTEVNEETSDHYVINVQTFIVNYSAASGGPGDGTYNITMSSGQRISTLQNSPNKAFGFETSVIIDNIARTSPQTSIAPIVFAPIDTTWTKQIPTIPNSGLTFALASTLASPDEEVSIYGNWAQIAGLSVDSDTGILSLNTAGQTVGHQNTVVVLISDGTTTIAVDFILEYVADNEVPTISPSGDLNECVYAGLSYSYTFVASTSDSSAPLTWTHTTPTVANLSYDTSITNTLTVTFNPSYSQIGDSEFVRYEVENQNNTMKSILNITFTVKKADIDDLITIVNCAIKDVQVECDKLTAVEQIICMREKEVEIYKDAQKRLEDNKKKYGKK